MEKGGVVWGLGSGVVVVVVVGCGGGGGHEEQKYDAGFWVLEK